MSNEKLRAELESLDWQTLRTRAYKDYGIKILPEYKKEDIIRLVLDKESGATKYVTDKEDLSAKNSRYGWSRIRVLPGRRETDTHCRACHNGYQFAIPFDVEVNIPTVTAEYLTKKKTPYPVANEIGGTEMKYDSRWIVQFIEKNYGPNGESEYIPPEAVGKYWVGAREAKLRVKREFMKRYGYWPTDKAIKKVIDNGSFKVTELEGPR